MEEEEDDEGVAEDEPGGGYLKRSAGFGLCGLNILRGSTVGLSQSSVGAGLLRKSSSSEIPLLRSIAQVAGPWKRWICMLYFLMPWMILPRFSDTCIDLSSDRKQPSN